MSAPTRKEPSTPAGVRVSQTYENARIACLGYAGVFLFREPIDTDRKKTKKSYISFRHSVTSLVHIPMSAPTRKEPSTPAGVRVSQELFNARGAIMVSRALELKQS